MRRHSARAVLGFTAALAALACGPTASGVYCQSGPRYGTECYARPDVVDPPGAPYEAPDPTEGERAGPALQ
jgi:hypothetical protein